MNTQEPDDQLLARMRQTLDQCAGQSDEHFNARLEQLAQQAQQTRKQRLAIKPRAAGLMLIGFALAAGVAVIAIIPSTLITTKTVPPAPIAAAATVPSVDPQFLEDMDMLMVLGEDNNES